MSLSFIILEFEVTLTSKFLYVLLYMSEVKFTVLRVLSPEREDIPPKVLTKFWKNANFSVINSNCFNSSDIDDDVDEDEEEEEDKEVDAVIDEGGDNKDVEGKGDTEVNGFVIDEVKEGTL